MPRFTVRRIATVAVTLPMLRNTPKNHQGFSLVELMIVLAVLAVVLGFAVPNMRQMMLNNRVKAATNSLLGALQMARNEAITRNKEITFAPDVIVCSAEEKSKKPENCETIYRNGALLKIGSDIIGRMERAPDGVKIEPASTVLTFKATGATKATKMKVSLEGASTRTVCIGMFGQVRALEGDVSCN